MKVAWGMVMEVGRKIEEIEKDLGQRIFWWVFEVMR